MPTKKNIGKTVVNNVLKQQWIVTNIGFFLFLAFLTVVYIANGHTADKTIRDISRTAKQLKELQYEYKTLKSEMMFKSRETEMLKTVESLGFKVSAEPPMRLSVNGRESN